MDYKEKYIKKIGITLVLVAGIVFFLFIYVKKSTPEAQTNIISTGTTSVKDKSIPNVDPTRPSAIIQPEIIATGLKIPWDLAFLPDQGLLVTERAGNLVHIEKDGNVTSISLPHPVPKGEGGLLGIVLHPNFATNRFLYLYMTTQNDIGGTKNAVFRYRYENKKLTNEEVVISGIPGAIYHDGGRMEFGPDGFLYITTGDAQTPAIAQNLNSLGGKILRVTDDGDVPTDNPFGTAVYSYGHRNPQGLAWDDEGRLWGTEHGRSGITSGMDEINLIEKGKNYGWPDIEGTKSKDGMETPVENSGPNETWAPASLVFLNGSLFFGGLLGESLYEAVITGDHTHEKGHVDIHAFNSYFKNDYGRIRTVRVGPDGMLYLTTSNRDGRGKPITEDDRIIRIDPRGL